MDEKIIESNIKQQKDPVELSLNKIKEAATKEGLKKIEDQTNKVVSAAKIFMEEKRKLDDIKLDIEADKISLNNLLSLMV